MDPDLWFAGAGDGELSESDIEALLKQRDSARGNRDFAAADAIRDQLAAAGVTIEDGAAGTRWRRGT
jgi:cysteinyl-tRNA synthetase